MTSFPVEVLFEALANNVWRGCLLTAAMAMLLRFMKKTTAAERYSVWLAVLFVIATAPVMETTIAWLPRAALPVSDHIAAPYTQLLDLSSEAETDSMLPTSSWFFSSFEIPARPLLWGWLAICLSLAVRLGWRCLLAIDLKRCSDAPAPSLAKAVQEWERRLSARRRAPTRISRQIKSPGAVGWLRPTVLLPEACERQAQSEDLELLWRHEQAHIARRDDWTQAVSEAACAVMWFHPAVYWVRRQMDQEREIACDEAVLETGVDANSYVGALGRWAEQEALQIVPEGVLGIGRSQAQVIRRIEMLLSPSRVFRPGGAYWSFVMSLALTVGLTVLLMLTGPSIVKAQVEEKPLVEIETPVHMDFTNDVEATENAPVNVPKPVAVSVPVELSVPVALPLLPIPPSPPLALVAQAPAVAPVPPQPLTPAVTPSLSEHTAVEQTRRWKEEMQPFIEAMQQESERIQRYVEDNMRPQQEKLQAIAKTLSEEHTKSIAPLAKEMAELGAKMAEATAEIQRDDIQKKMEAIAAQMKEYEPDFRKLEYELSKIEINMKPLEERLHELKKVLEQKEEAFQKANEAFEKSKP